MKLIDVVDVAVAIKTGPNGYKLPTKLRLSLSTINERIAVMKELRRKAELSKIKTYVPTAHME